jgi:transcriptional regulator with GAF, ATPase, and Fis domain
MPGRGLILGTQIPGIFFMIHTHSLLASLARLVTEASALDVTLSRVAVLLREAIPFERLRVLRLDRADAVTLYAIRASGEIDITGHLIGDAPSAAEDTADGVDRSRLICTIRQGARVKGAVWLTSSAPDAFTDEHQELLDAVGDLITLALYHDTVRTTELRRRERIDALVRLLQTVAETLDIRQIFPQLSDTIRGALPHDILALTAWAEDGLSFQVYAMAGADIPDESFWGPTLLTPVERTLLDRKAYIIHDVNSEVAAETIRGRLLRRVGARSALRVAIPLGSSVFGSLFFVAHEPGRFSEDDVDFARRVADHLALALSHQHLADAEKRDAAARETAARLEAQVATLTRELEARSGQRRVVGHSRQWQDVLAQAARVAQAETTVLLTGESGTGKEVIARFIHHASRRSSGPFIAINCAALPDQLLESELFGYERGAFTGAVSAKPGRIEQANGGVLFLDEVGEMAPTVQAKLLRVLEEREFQRLGGTRLHHADIRVISATNRDLHGAMQRGEFREDLYYRLGVFEIELPPLRDRAEDVLELADTFLREIGETVGRPAAGFERDAKRDLLAYPWPGNVRELRNAIERAVILADGGYIRSEHLPVSATRKAPSSVEASGPPLPAGGVNLDAIERSLVVKALHQARHNKTRAAKLLGLTRAQLYSRIEKYGLAETES